MTYLAVTLKGHATDCVVNSGSLERGRWEERFIREGVRMINDNFWKRNFMDNAPQLF